MLRNNKVIILSRILISYSFIALTLTCFGMFGISWCALVIVPVKLQSVKCMVLPIGK